MSMTERSRSVVQMYADACERGDTRPNRSVAAMTGLTIRTVESIVYRARKDGLLDPTDAGRAPAKLHKCPTCGRPIHREDTTA